jgi:putative SOS response-associated peptidase YedK
MCGRYVRRSDKQKIAEYFAVHGPSLPDFGPSWNVAPQTFQPVIRLNRDTGEREIVLMRWGLVPFWARDAKVGYSTINAQAETITISPTYREAFKHRRCLVPADAFYEWVKIDSKTKQPFAIALKTGEPYAFAGLWEIWRDTNAGTALRSFAIVTTDPNMPAIIPERDYDRWLRAEPDRPPIDLLRPYDAGKMTAWKVDKAVGNVKNDRPELIDQIQDDEPPPSRFGS